MISPEEEIYSPQSKNPCDAKDNVPKQFAYVETITLGSKCLRGGAFAIIIVVIAIVATVALHGDLSKYFHLFAKSFGQYWVWHPNCNWPRNMHLLKNPQFLT